MKYNANKALKLLFLCLFCMYHIGSAQLISTSLIEDSYRSDTIIQKQKQTNAKIQAYTDTLRLPFFEDFSGIVIPIDSITISTSDNLIKIHSKVLANHPDGTAIFVGFEAPVALTLTDTLSKKIWYIKAIATNTFTIDDNITLTTPEKAFSVNITYTNAYWRHVENKYTPTPDSLKWVSNGNTYINNRFPINPVSYNVATFDGLKSDGAPYNSVNVLAKGYSDHLTSLPINLAGLTASDNVYFSFFWQHNGVGDAPEEEDYLELQFRDNAGTWITIKTISGDTTAMSNFKYEIIQLTDPIYFSNKFQFRLRSYGRLSGPYDIWNIDYIYLNKNRTVLDSRIFDFTIGNTTVSFLKNYTSMPYGQYFADKANEIGTLKFTVNNLDRNLTANQSLQGRCLLTTTAGAYNYTYLDVAANHNTGNSILTYQDVCNLLTDSLQNQNLPMNVRIKYNLLGSTDTTNILFAHNNTYLNSTVLWDYYAYDDGSAEWGVAGNQSGAKIANKYTVNLKDTITDIDIYFTRSKGPNMDGRSILISVWNENHELMTQQSGQVKYSGFTRYKLNTPAIIEAGKDFYVGYQQNFVDLLSIGYDKNYNHADKVFFNLSGSTWNAYNQQPGFVEGSMMIRPVFSKNQILALPTIPKEETYETTLYPIPADDILKIQGSISTIRIYNLTGTKVAQKDFNPFLPEKEIDTAQLPNGLYIAEIHLNNTVIIKKILIQHNF